MSEFRGIYIKPDYSRSYDSDDDDDDDDDDLEDFTNEDEGKEDNFIESLEKNKETNKTMQTTPFGQSINNNSPWNSIPSQPSSPWSQPTSNQPTFGTGNWRPSNGPAWGNNWNNNTGSTWNNNSTSKSRELPRDKKFIFCDVLDCLVETLQSNGRPGLLPRGIFDIRLRFDVWDRIACFSPTKVYAMIPRSLILCSNGSESWKILLEYISCSLSEYLRIPYPSCQILVQNTVGQPKEDIIDSILNNSNSIPRDKAILIGINSGLYGQSNIDKVVSDNCKIDYIDLGELMNKYY